MNNFIYPIILAGGSGTRLWPQSREKYPKQFIPLIDGRSLFQETCLRFSNTTLFPFLTIVTHEDHKFLVRDQLQELGILNAYILTEPVAKNTAAACLLAAYFLKDKVGNVPLLFTPADHIIIDEQYLFDAITNAYPFVVDGAICIFGITPTSPHTGYGYITGTESLGKGIVKPDAFIEKPNKEKAEELLKEGAFWNSGLYFCTPDTLIKESATYIKSIQEPLGNFFKETLQMTQEFFVIDKNIYENLESISIDKGVTEHTKKLILAHTAINWSDLGSWSSLYNHFAKNEDGNVIRGDSVAIATRNSYIESNSKLVAVLGLEDIGIVETADAVMVFSLKEGETIKKLVGALSKSERREMKTHLTVHRPWGKYTLLDENEVSQSRKITVLPGAGFSLQKHTKRAEHWIITKGIASVTKGEEVFELRPNESTFIPMGVAHRLENKHSEILCLIEIQTGTYFGEDDIERLEDIYGRK